MRPALLASVALLLIAAPARAEPPRHAFQLDYVRGNGALACPDEAALRKELVGIMHHDPVQPSAPHRLTAIIERRGAELTGVAIMRDDAGHVLWQTDTIPTTSPCRILVVTARQTPS